MKGGEQHGMKTYAEMHAVEFKPAPGGYVYVLEDGQAFPLPSSVVLYMVNMWRKYWHRAKEQGGDNFEDWMLQEK